MANYLGITKPFATTFPIANLDYDYGPYTSLSDALTNLPAKLRTIGKTVGIITGGIISEYWFKSGINDTDLVAKNSGTGGFIGSGGFLGSFSYSGTLPTPTSSGYYILSTVLNYTNDSLILQGSIGDFLVVDVNVGDISTTTYSYHIISTSGNVVTLSGEQTITGTKHFTNGITANTITVTSYIGSPDYVSQTTGWRIDSNGNSDFRKIYADELDVQAFTAQVSQALAGSDFLTKSVSKLSYNFSVPGAIGATARLIVDDLEGFPAVQCFSNGDYIRLRPINNNGGLIVGNAYGTVTLDTTYGTNGFINGTQAYTFVVTYISNGAGLTVYKGSEVLDYGKSGDGLIKRTVLDSAGSPYMDISTWANDPAVNTNYTTHLRLGNLSGVSNCSGYGLYSDNVFLTKQILIGDLSKQGSYLSFDSTNGLVIKLSSGNIATTGDINGAVSSANSYTDTKFSILNGNISSAISTIQGGGNNLLVNSNFYDSLNHWLYNTNFTPIVKTDDTYGHILQLHNITANGTNLYSANNVITATGQYTLSVWMKADNALTVEFGFTNNFSLQAAVTTTWKQFVVVGNITAVTNAVYFAAQSIGTDYYIANIKLESGSTATNWSPSPVDVMNAVSLAQSNAISQAAADAEILYVTKTAYNSYVSQTAQEISEKVTVDTFNALGTRVSNAESAITANANAITSKVSTTDYTGNTIASLINQTATTIQLSATKINLAGAVTISSFNSDALTTVQGYSTTAVNTFSSNHGDFTFINGDSVYTGSLNANQVTAGYISSDRIAANSITTDKLATNVLTVGNVSGLGDLAIMNNITSSLVTDLGTLATLNNIGLTNLNSTVIDTNGHLVTSLVVANEVLTNALASGTIVAGNATITNLKAKNVNITGVLTPTLYYTPFKRIISDDYIINPIIDGNCIEPYPTSVPVMPTFTFPNANDWGGLRLYIKVSGLTINLVSSGFSFNGDNLPIGDYRDSNTSLYPPDGIFEFVSSNGTWVAVNYPTSKSYDVGTLVLTSESSFYIGRETTVVFKNTVAAHCYLPENPFVGQSVVIYRRGTDLTVNATNSKVIFQGGTTASSIFLAIGDSATFKYDGEMWVCMYTYQPVS